MRQARDEETLTYQEVIANAAGLCRERGIDRTSVGDVMQAADKPHGGFYRRFESREALLVTALASALPTCWGIWEKALPRCPARRRLPGN